MISLGLSHSQMYNSMEVSEMTKKHANDVSSTAAFNSLLSLQLTCSRSDVQPVIIGNINGADLLTAAVMNKQETTQTSSDLTPVQSVAVINLVSLFIQQADGNPKRLTPNTAAVSAEWDMEQVMDKDNTQELENNSDDEHPSRVSVMIQGSELDCRLPLSSSDTVILDTSSSINTPNALPCSSSTLISNDSSIFEKLLARDRSPVYTIKKPFSLLTNISDRSVSLESIPSFGLFQPDHEHTSNISANKPDTVERISDSAKDTTEAMIPDPVGSADTSKMAVVGGGNKIPHSILLLVKPGLNNISPGDKQICLTTSLEQTKDNSSVQHKTVKDHNINSCLSDKQELDVADEEHSDTDTEMNKAAPSVGSTKGNLTRCDTIVLDGINYSKVICSGLQLQSSDTIILACDDQEVQSEDKLSEGFSFTSTNSSSTLSLEAMPNPTINTNMPIEVINTSSVNQSSIPFQLQSFKNGHSSKSLYVLTSDGHLAAVRYISQDPLDSSQLSQLGLFNTVDVIPQVLLQNSFNAPSRSVEAKETQTDLMFGTNTLHFKLPDTMSDSSIYSIEQLNNTVFVESMRSLTTQPSAIPSTVVESDNTRPSTEPQLETIQGSVTLLTNRKTREKMVLRSSQTKSTEGDFFQQQISRSGSSKDDCYFFKCEECQQNFKTKYDLVNHQKVHKNGFKCDLCNATFTRIGNFNRHRKIHNLQAENQNAFKCDDCGREFLQRCDLKRHLLIHTKQEPYRCPQCGKGYIRRNDLVVHLRFHNKEKTFVCTVCGKKFFQTGDLSRHVRQAHMPNSQLTCGHCNRKYACESTLLRHMKAVHKDIILSTVNQTLQNPDSSDNGSTVNTKDVLFTTTK